MEQDGVAAIFAPPRAKHHLKDERAGFRSESPASRIHCTPSLARRPVVQEDRLFFDGKNGRLAGTELRLDTSRD